MKKERKKRNKLILLILIIIIIILFFTIFLIFSKDSTVNTDNAENSGLSSLSSLNTSYSFLEVPKLSRNYSAAVIGCECSNTNNLCPNEVKEKCGDKPTTPEKCEPAYTKCDDKNKYPNFIVYEKKGCACVIANLSEYYRCKLAVELTGNKPPNLDKPITINAKWGDDLGVGGGIVASFDRIDMQGAWDKLVNDLIPHEIQHVITRDNFKKQTPRWFDEGLCDSSESNKKKCSYFLGISQYERTGRIIPLTDIITKLEYHEDMLVIYKEGWSITEYLLNVGKKLGDAGCSSKRRLLGTGKEAMDNGNTLASWDAAIKKSYGAYGINNTRDLENMWRADLRKQMADVCNYCTPDCIN